MLAHQPPAGFDRHRRGPHGGLRRNRGALAGPRPTGTPARRRGPAPAGDGDHRRSPGTAARGPPPARPGRRPADGAGPGRATWTTAAPGVLGRVIDIGLAAICVAPPALPPTPPAMSRTTASRA